MLLFWQNISALVNYQMDMIVNQPVISITYWTLSPDEITLSKQYFPYFMYVEARCQRDPIICPKWYYLNVTDIFQCSFKPG